MIGSIRAGNYQFFFFLFIKILAFDIKNKRKVCHHTHMWGKKNPKLIKFILYIYITIVATIFDLLVYKIWINFRGFMFSGFFRWMCGKIYPFLKKK